MAEASTGFTDAELERLYPWIKWREPIKVIGVMPNVGAVERFACRFCIGLYGLRGDDVANLYETVEDHAAHMAEFHIA